ncbi:hypothetical protein RE428_18460 [Marinobacter nanhaiticus D15-8W]|uniref:Uncharacterized protein n=1 Tax=Marinobacter nanhaiticus D15-8W TaxID=626887 RepID=N6WQX7_9GAMM|nr:hypothetical protein [Marinobacter nanhaiticus]ENO13462.1 hypothetical protein J057_18740 [Marinobacter nanhaiticus D15-8W]BES70828.1 hypothetical protein RE428_18460 [Marinobacter nanhaiticus D15-8W]
MSLLASLARAGASFQQAAENRAARQAAAQTAAAAPEDKAVVATDDSVTLNGGAVRKPSSQLSVNRYKQDVGQDHTFVRETLRHKLAEYSLNPATRIAVEKKDTGGFAIKAMMPESTRQQIEKDLDNNKGFREAFNRLSVNEPTLSFVDNAVRLNQAYGVNNALLDQMVSENQQFNGLQDLTHRFDSLRRTANAASLEAAGQSRQYAFSLNARA